MRFDFSRSTTSTGIPLWTLTLPHATSVAAGVVVLAGTRDEAWPREAGIAHALEHMHFQGTAEFPTSRDVAAQIEEVGGVLNAWTSKEMTLYYARVPASYARRAVRVLGEQLNAPLLPAEKIESEMRTIVQEIRRRNDDPSRFVSMVSNGALYGDHPLSRDTLGVEDSVRSFTREDFVRFRDRYYHAGNYALVVAGNITQEESRALFDEYLPARAGRALSRPVCERPLRPGGRKVVKRDIEQCHAVLAAAFGGVAEPSSLHMDFFSDMIAGGMSFPLFQEVRDRRGLCYSIHASVQMWSDVGTFRVYLGTDPERFREAIDVTLSVIAEHASDAELLDSVKRLKIGQLDLLYENTSGILNSAARDIAQIGEPRGYARVLREIEDVTIGDLEKSVTAYLKPELVHTTVLAPLGFSADGFEE